jgi:crotonobetainyl-CoA:carnitine CoA-transferase CaiB-like acyl-CoA transferase
MSIADIAADPHYQARDMVAHVPDARFSAGEAIMPGIVPRLSSTPGEIRHAGGELGADNQAIYSDLLGLSPSELAHLTEQGVL